MASPEEDKFELEVAEIPELLENWHVVGYRNSIGKT